MSLVNFPLRFPQSPANTRSQSQASQHALRFGWTKQSLLDNPDRFTITLRDKKDVKQSANGELIPQPALARRIAARITRNGNLDIPGFVYITNTSEHIAARNNSEMYSKTRSFIERLTGLLHSQFTKRMPDMAQWNHTLMHDSFHRPDGQLTNANGKKFPQKESLKTFHKDPHSVLATHAYGPSQGHDGGELLILDDQEVAKKYQVKPEDLYEIRPEEEGNIPCTPHLKDEWAKKIGGTDSEHIFVANTHPGKTKDGLDSIPVFVFSNLEVGHGATPLRVFDEAKMQRGFYRSSQKVKKTEVHQPLPFLPFHKPELHQ